MGRVTGGGFVVGIFGAALFSCGSPDLDCCEVDSGFPTLGNFDAGRPVTGGDKDTGAYDGGGGNVGTGGSSGTGVGTGSGGTVLDSGVKPADSGVTPVDAGSTKGDAGGGVTVDAGSFVEPGFRYVFVTSQQFTGDLKTEGEGAYGVEGADNICNALARARMLQGTWMAYVSYPFIRAHERFSWAGPWRVRGYVIGHGPVAFQTTAAMASSGPLVPLRDEQGQEVSVRAAWTGVTANGSRSNDCNEWESASGSIYGVNSGLPWNTGLLNACKFKMRLLCFQQTPPPGPALLGPAKRVFVTSKTYSGNLKAAAGAASGPLGGDALCQSAASSAGLNGTWMAYLASPGVSAPSRFTGNGPWKLLGSTNDYSFLNIDALRYTQPLALINKTETGQTVPNNTPSRKVWTGAKERGATTTNDCNGWTDSTGAQSGTVGTPEYITDKWRTDTDLPCDNVARLYCFEQ